MQSATDHAPVNRDRHAEIVSYITRHCPNAWRVLFRPDNYLFDKQDHDRSVSIELRSSELRIRFNSETEWRGAVEIISTLLRLDREACRMSIGSIIDGKEYLGEYVGADAR